MLSVSIAYPVGPAFKGKFFSKFGTTGYLNIISIADSIYNTYYEWKLLKIDLYLFQKLDVRFQYSTDGGECVLLSACNHILLYH